ncbi:MAG: hypothetical protein JWO71_3198 [Candidatus Acidoferrum typicum]|nr:hypothetical protein [Candidatus Acidoferrum typicum]
MQCLRQTLHSRQGNSQKRLAHAKDKIGGSPAAQNGMKAIVEIYNTLSAENKKRVLADLASAEQEPS